MQMSFELPEINRDSTKKKVEAALEKYTMYLLMDPVDMEPKVTASYSLTPPTNTNEFHSKTEDKAIEKIDQERERRNYILMVQKAVNRLGFNERSVIIERYMKGDDIFDYEVYNELGFSERKYYRLKARAFYKLAFILRLEEYKEDHQS